MNNCLVSVIIPAYNSSQYVAETISSVIDQSFSNWELLIIDDGSIDNQKQVIAPFLKDARIQYFFKKNSGVSSTRNFGLENSRGKFVVFLDADDLFEPNFILSKLENIGDRDFIGSHVKHFTDKNLSPIKITKSITEDLFEHTLMYSEDRVSCPSAYMFRSSFLKKNKILFDSRLSSIADR